MPVDSFQNVKMYLEWMTSQACPLVQRSTQLKRWWILLQTMFLHEKRYYLSAFTLFESRQFKFNMVDSKKGEQVTGKNAGAPQATVGQGLAIKIDRTDRASKTDSQVITTLTKVDLASQIRQDATCKAVSMGSRGFSKMRWATQMILSKADLNHRYL